MTEDVFIVEIFNPQLNKEKNQNMSEVIQHSDHVRGFSLGRSLWLHWQLVLWSHIKVLKLIKSKQSKQESDGYFIPSAKGSPHESLVSILFATQSSSSGYQRSAVFALSPEWVFLAICPCLHLINAAGHTVCISKRRRLLAHDWGQIATRLRTLINDVWKGYRHSVCSSAPGQDRLTERRHLSELQHFVSSLRLMDRFHKTSTDT